MLLGSRKITTLNHRADGQLR